MTSISGYELIATPCCKKVYATPRFASVNFTSSAFWTDGKRENSLMPNDGGLRKCSCNSFFTLRECIKLGIEADENPNFPQYVHSSELPNAIQSAMTLNVEMAARRAYWMHLNDEYRELYKAHRKSEDLEREAQWVKNWNAANPDNRSKFQRLIDKLLIRKRPIIPPLPDYQITFPKFEPSKIQTENMLRLVELVTSNPENYSKEYPVELAELHRELGNFEEANRLLINVSLENQDVVTNLMLDLSNRKESAPVRYRY